MATAEVVPPTPRIESAQQLQPGIQTLQNQNPLLPPMHEGSLLTSNVRAEFLPAEQMPDPRPSRVLFAGLRDPRLRMVRAIPLDVTLEESNVIVCWQDIDEFGIGETLSEALDDFSSVVRELYKRLRESNELGPDLQRVKQVLGEYIEPRAK